MYADPKKVRIRRLKRRLKASASIVLATAAGVFLACQRRLADEPVRPPEPSPMGPDARTGPEPPDLPDAATVPQATPDAAPPDAATRNKDAAVDVDEHRKGMPVRDNLLE